MGLLHYGVVVVIAWATGEVLDTELLSKYCYQCAACKLSKGTLEYNGWYENHKDLCKSNYEGSSCAMEMEGALRVFKRSITDFNLRYTTVISDGDSSALNTEKVYGPGVEIVKHECVGHVQKRVGKRLRELKKGKQATACHESTKDLIRES